MIISVNPLRSACDAAEPESAEGKYASSAMGGVGLGADQFPAAFREETLYTERFKKCGSSAILGVVKPDNVCYSIKKQMLLLREKAFRRFAARPGAE